MIEYKVLASASILWGMTLIFAFEISQLMIIFIPTASLGYLQLLTTPLGVLFMSIVFVSLIISLGFNQRGKRQLFIALLDVFESLAGYVVFVLLGIWELLLFIPSFIYLNRQPEFLTNTVNIIINNFIKYK